jgi:hypothetical protein
MTTIGKTHAAIVEVDKQITLERKKGTGRDKSKIVALQKEHHELTAKYASLHEDDRVTPKDTTDKSGEEFKVEEKKKSEKKKKDFIEKTLRERSREGKSESNNSPIDQ